MASHVPRADGSPSPPGRIERGAFPFPLTDGPTESPYLTWLRHRSNYMATQGLFDYLRAIGVLVRGIVVNFLIFLPYLLVAALGLAYAHHWMLEHPFRLTLLAFLAAVIWILVFPVAIPIFAIARYTRSVETGSASTVAQRDRYERSFGLAVLVVLGCAVLESMPWVLEYVHDAVELRQFAVGGGLATFGAAVAVFSGAAKLLSLLRGAGRAIAMVLIGALGLAVPLAVVLLATDFLVYGLPPSPQMMFGPLVVPIVGVVGIAIALPLGYARRAFTRRELAVVSGMLVVTLALVAAAVVGGVIARGARAEGLNDLDERLGPLQEVVSRLDATGSRDALAPDVASVVDAFVAAHRRAQGEGAALQTELQTLLEATERDRQPCDRSPRAWFADGARSFWASVECWRAAARFDAQWAEWDARYFSVRMPFVVLGHRLSGQSDQRLAPLRQSITGLARADTRAQIEAVAGDDRAAELLRRSLVEQFFAPVAPWPPAAGNELAGLVAERFERASADLDRQRNALAGAGTVLRRATVADIVPLVGEAALFGRVATKFAAVPGTAETARLTGKEALARLLTPGELVDLVFEEHARSDAARVHRRRFLDDALPAFPDVRPGVSGETYTREIRATAQALARLADAAPSMDPSDGSLAFYFGTRRGLTPAGDADAPAVPQAVETGRAAGLRLAQRALADLDVAALAVLGFQLDRPVDEVRRRPLFTAASTSPASALPEFLASRAGDLQGVVDAARQDWAERERLEAFLARARLPLGELASHAFPLLSDDRPDPAPPPGAAYARRLEGLKLYQWPEGDARRVVLAARAVGHDTEEVARLARAVLADRVLAVGSGIAPDDRRRILDEFASFDPARLGEEELAELAVAHFVTADTAAAEELLTLVRYGRYGRLEQAGLGMVKRQLTAAVMPPKAIFVSLLAVVIWLGCWLTVDVNLTSAHGLYRDRLASAFLVGVDTKGDIGIEHDVDLDDLSLHEARSTAPYHLINGALNLQGSADPGLRDRRSDFFVFSKRFVGGGRTGYCRSERLEHVYPQMSVATAMAISAAAASPNMGRATSPLLVAFMTLLNIRLGHWMPNPGRLERSGQEPRWRLRPREEVPAPSGYSFEEVFASELGEVERRWEQAYAVPCRQLHGVDRPTVDHGLVGMGCSGGGIRSAALNLGIIQALHRAGVFDHVDYLSTVSGGGYLGSSISTLMRSRECLVSEIGGTVAVSRSSGDGQRVVVAAPDGGVREYLFTRHAALNVRDGEHIPAGRPLLKPPQARGQSDIAGTVTVERDGTGASVVTVDGDGDRREYRFSRFDVPSVRTGQRVAVGQELVARHDTLGEQFRWRVRPVSFLREMLGLLDEQRRWVNVSDGGHIENLGGIELLRRRCKFIIIGDGEADPDLHLGGLATLVRCAAIDLGITIDVPIDALRSRPRGVPGEGAVSLAHWAVGTIRYPPRDGAERTEEGYLLYLKSSVTGDEDVTVQEYRHRHPTFPHQTTADQFFDEDQFEAYRALGQHIAESALASAGQARPSSPMSFADVERWFEQLRAQAVTDAPASVA